MRKIIEFASDWYFGLVARAKEKGVMQRAKPVIQELCEKGLYASEDIVKWILNEVGE